LKTGEFVTKKHLHSFNMGMVLENWLLRSPHKASKLLRIAYKASIVATIIIPLCFSGCYSFEVKCKM